MRRTMTTFATLGLLVATAAACGGDDGAATGSTVTSTAPTTSAGPTSTSAEPTTTGTPTTTVAPTTTRPEPTRFDERGPFAVGVLTLSLGDRQTEVFYPADSAAAAGRPTDSYNTLDLFPESLRAAIPEALVAELDMGAVRDVRAAGDGPFPVIVYSHGFGGYRFVTSFHLAHLASWGFVVASTDHLERGLIAQATGATAGVPGQDLTDVRNTLAELAVQNAGTGLLAGTVDLDRVGVTGHSAGAGTAIRAATSEPEIDAFASISGGQAVSVLGDPIGVRGALVTGLAPGDYEITVEQVGNESAIVRYWDEPSTSLPLDDLTVAVGDGSIRLTAAGDVLTPGTVTIRYAVPTVPALVVSGADDGVIAADVSRTMFDTLGNPKYLVSVANAGHNSFTDTCPDILARGGLESLRPLIGRLVDLAQDGCTPGVVDPVLVQRILNHYSTAFFLTFVAGDDYTAALAVDVTAELGDVSLADFEVG